MSSRDLPARLLTTKEVASLLRLTTDTIQDKAAHGEIPHYRMPSRRILFRPDDIEAYLAARYRAACASKARAERT